MLGFNMYILLAALVLLLFFVFKRLFSIRLAVLCLIIYALAILYAGYRTPKPDALYAKAPSKPELTGRVVSEPRPDLKNKTKFYFLTDEGKTLVYIYDYKRKFDIIKIGDVIKLEGSLKHPYKATNPGQFDYSKYLKNNGVFTLTHVSHKNWEITESPNSGIWYFARKISELREKIIATHAKNLKSPKLEILGGMVFGDYAVPAPDNVEEDFIKSGLLHLLAASGLNVGIIFGVWFFLASRTGVPFKPKIIIGMLLVGVYALMTGLPPSVTRAALMMELLLFGKLLDRKADNTGILLMVCALMLLYNPIMIASVGFQLSFIVTFGLLLFARFFNFWSGIFLIPLVAQMFAAPVQVFHFNNFAIYSVLANMAVMPFVGIISFAGFSGSILSLIPFIGEKLCFLADKIAEPFIFLLLFISKFTADLPGALQYLPKPGIGLIITLYALLVIPVFSRKMIIIPALMLIILTFKWPSAQNLEFVFFDVGQGDAVLINTPNNRHILVDTGPPGRYSPARTAIVTYFRDNGIKNLDALVLTHPDSDHIGGTIDILKAVKVQTVYHNGTEDNSKIYKAINGFLGENGHRTAVLRDKNILIPDEDLVITAIKSDNTDMKDDNEDSIILYLVYKDFSALLMADCLAGALNKVSETVKAPVDLLKVGHHGSEGSVSEEFLGYTTPEVTVISVGSKGYRWGHPNPVTIALLEEFKSRIYRTDKDYAIRITTDGYGISINKFGDKQWK